MHIHAPFMRYFEENLMPPEQQLIGNRYQVLNEIGSGGMGAVYRVLDRLTGQTVALKRVTVPGEQLLFASLGASTDYRLALAQEFRTLASLRHPHIISVLDYGFHDKQPYFTMDLLAAPKTITAHGRDQSIQRKVELLAQLLQALTYLHRRGIIHRDLKPDNVQVVEGQVKVLDFGLAVARDYLKGDGGSGDEVVGTLAYMAPEVLQGGQASESADLYAVGIIAYELFAGEYPFDVSSITQLLQDIIVKTPDIKNLDLTEEMQGVIERLVAKDADSRYTDANAARSALVLASGGQAEAETAAIRESFLQAAKFVGREAEMVQLSAALQRVISIKPSSGQGGGSAWLIAGESGVGKSRLLDELRVQALVEGVVVVRGQAVTEEGAPYSLWRDVLRRLSLHTELTDLEASVLKTVVPDLSKVLEKDIPDAPTIDPGAARQRFLTVIEDVFRRQTQPVLLILEDLHWGGDSLLVLGKLAPIAAELPVMIVASYRDDERPDLPSEFPNMQVMSLSRLSRGQVEELSTSILGEGVGHKEAIVDLLQRETEGNVFFIVEVIRALAEEAGTLDAIGWRTLPAQVFSGGMKTVIERRLSRLPEYAHALLEVVAVAGRQLDLKLLRALSPETDLDKWLSDALEASVIAIEDNAWRIAHDKLREAVLGSLSADQRRDKHRQIAENIEKVYADDNSQLSILAYHWGEAGNIHKEADYSARAGEQVLKDGAYQSALPLLRRAIELAPKVGIEIGRLAYLHFLVGEANWGAGDMFGCTQYLEDALRLVDLPTWPTEKSPTEIVQGFAVHIMSNPNPDTDGEASNDLVWAVRANERLGQVYYVQNEALPVIFYDYGGLELAARIGKAAKPELVRLSGSSSVAMSNVPLHDLARAYIQFVDAYVDTLTDASAQCWGLMTTGVTFGGWGLWDEAMPRYERTIAIADSIGDTQRWFEAGSFITSSLHHTGRYDDAVKFNERFYTLFKSQNFLPAAIWCGAGRVLNAVNRGDHATALSYASEAEAALELLKDRLNNMRIFGQVARIYLRLGQIDRAKQYAERVVPLLAESTPSAWQAIDGCASIAEFYVTLHEMERTPESEDKARSACGYLEGFSRIFDIGRPQLKVYQGWFGVMIGELEYGLGTIREGIDDAQTLKMPFEEALGHYHLGRLLPDGHEDKRASLESALAIFDRLGATWDAAKVREALA